MLSTGLVRGQDYPSKPIRLVSPGPGGGADFVARLIGQGISGPLGQQVVIDNRPAGIIPGQIVSKARPDGYTILVNGNSFWLGPLLESNSPFDALKDFSPITLAVSTPNVLVVHAAIPASSVKELIALAKAKPGTLNYASSAAGGAVHLSSELFRQMTGIDIVRINYKTSGASITALLAGEVQIMFANAPSMAPHVKTGRLKALAVTTLKPSALYPGLPTVAAAGLPGFDVASVFGVFGPAGMPAPIVTRLNREIVQFLASPEAKERLITGGGEPVGSTPAQLLAAMKAETARMSRVIKSERN